MRADHLYPPVPGMLRRGTPVVVEPHGVRSVVLADNHGLMHLAPNIWHPMGSLRLDLRDPTARAHAAWYYVHDAARWGRITTAGSTVCGCLEQMASGDPEITPKQARAALEWAARVCVCGVADD